MTRPGPARVGMLALALLALGVGASGCDRHEDHDEAVGPSASTSMAAAEGIIQVSRQMQARAGIMVADVRRATARAEVNGFGAVIDPTQLAQLSAAYVGASSQLTAATARAAASRQAYERAEQLYRDDRNVSLADLQAAEAAWRADQAAQTAAQAQTLAARTAAAGALGPALGARGGKDSLVRSLVERRSFLVQVTAEPGRALFPSAAAVLETTDGRRVIARLLGPAPQVDPRLQALSYYYVARATTGLLPGMNLSVLQATGQIRSGVEVPASAIVTWNGASWAYERIGPESFRRIALAGTQPLPDGGVLTGALAPGAAVVVQGAELLLSHELQPQAESGGGGDED